MKKLITTSIAIIICLSSNLYSQANPECLLCIDRAAAEAQDCEFYAYLDYQSARNACINIYCNWGCNPHINGCCVDYYFDICENDAMDDFDYDLHHCSEQYWIQVDNYCFCLTCPCQTPEPVPS